MAAAIVMSTDLPVIVVGSGCTGAMAAQTLVEKGVRVLMLDGGVKETKYAPLIPSADFVTLRKTDEQQYRYLLGDALEGIPFGKVKTGEHLTPPRKFMTALTQQFIPLASENFMPLESLALGGLGNGWGLGCCVFSDKELQACSLNAGVMKAAYKTVAARIGISGTRDDAQPYTAAGLDGLQPSIQMDSNGKRLYAAYEKKRSRLQQKGFYMGRPSLALLTQPKQDRSPYPYHDMDFYSDASRSAYRPWLTIEALQKSPLFNYQGNLVVLRFSESDDAVTVTCLRTDTNETATFKGSRLVLAAGVLGTARIVLRSFDAYEHTLPVLSNPYSYLACIQPALLGRDTDAVKVGFAQLSLFWDKRGDNMDVPMGSVYSYRSMMLFHLLKDSPLGVKTAAAFLRYMQPAFTIVGLFHPEKYSPAKYLQLQKNSTRLTGDELQATYRLSFEEQNTVSETETAFTRALRQLNCFVLRKIEPGHGASIHYGGTLPFSKQNERFKLLPNGQLGDTQRVYVADGSGFTYLPGKGLTLSLMANAHAVADNLV